MAPAAQDTRTAGLSQAEFQAYIRAELRAAVRLALVSVLDAEMEALIGASRYERSPLRRDRRNGHYTRDLEACLAFYAFPASHGARFAPPTSSSACSKR
jgi:transposase-like protein